jgi:serine phosphatase RsbU (regulator of sigma subunit)
MHILIAWDDPNEAELLRLFLSAGEHEAGVFRTAAEVLDQARHEAWDAVLMSLTFPSTAEEGFAVFEEVQLALPGAPLVLACRPTEMIALTRFLTHGLRFYLIRDERADFVFLALSSLESAAAAARAEESRKLAERLRQEMDGVRKLQESIIPRGFAMPAGYRFAARYEPSQVSVVGDRPVVMAGGDYYDFSRPEANTLVVLMGDASGHGLKACMAIMAMHTLIRMLAGERYRDTAAFVAEINHRLCANAIVQSGGGFITLQFATIDTVSHTLRWTSAGHPPALLHRLTDDEVVPVGTEADGGLPLGIYPEAEYTSATLTLPPRSRLLLYTDGLTDAFPLEQAGYQAFGTRGVMETLRACRDEDLEQAVDRLFRASHAFTGGAGRHDDTSLVLLERA